METPISSSSPIFPPSFAAAMPPRDHPHNVHAAAYYGGRQPPLESMDLLSDLSVLQLTSQYLAGNNVIQIPPLRGENKEQWRSIFIDNVPNHMNTTDLLSMLKPRALECVRPVRGSGDVRKVEFRFLSHIFALQFYAGCKLHGHSLDGSPLPALLWAPTPPLSKEIAEAVAASGASRVLKLELAESVNKDDYYSVLRESLAKYGIIESLASSPGSESTKWTVCFVQIESAIEAHQNLKLAELRSISYAPPATLSRLQNQAAMLYLSLSPYDPNNLQKVPASKIERALACQSLAAALVGLLSGGEPNIGNRCICISRLPRGTRLVEICNTVRGGMLESVKLVSDRSICFVTFLEPTAAAQFWATYQLKPFHINCERVRVGWGRNPGPLRSEIEAVASKNVTRNVCIQFNPRILTEPQDGEDTDLEKTRIVVDEKGLWRIFAPFGIIEQIRIAHDVLCSFISFTNILNAAQAVDWAQQSDRFPLATVQYGKDRCAALPRCVARSPNQESPLVQFLRVELPLLYTQSNAFQAAYYNSRMFSPQLPLIPQVMPMHPYSVPPFLPDASGINGSLPESDLSREMDDSYVVYG